MKHISALLTTALALCLMQGCKQNQAPTPKNISTTPPAQHQNTPPDPATLGDVTGTVHFTGTPPPAVKIDTSMDPACALAGSPDFNAEQYVVNDGKLANVYIYIKSGPPTITAAVSTGPAAMIDQKGCRYTPHVIAIMRGDSVEFRNSDATMHNIHTMPLEVGNQPLDVSQGPKGAPVTKQFNGPEAMIPVRCNNHPWMSAFINVSATPFFAIADASGHFSLKGLPAGKYTLGAVHEKLGEQTLTITVPAKGTTKGDFTFAMK
jgi:plastocyanin